MPTIRLGALLGVSLIVLTACGGGDGTSTPAPIADPPPPPPPATSETFVTVQGEITGFGSVIVNGTRYDTDSAEIRKDGRDADLSDLSVGQIVALRARRNGDGELPTALRVRYEEVLEGPVESVAADGRSLVILGQTVFLTDNTVFEDGLDPAAIAVDDVLEVSGAFTADGDIVASYVELSDDVDGDYEVHGTVGALDTSAFTFRVKGLLVDYANAALDDFDEGEVLSNGDKVEVEGSVFRNDGALIATRVEFEGDDLDDFEGEDGDDDDENEAEIEGFITRFDSASDFAIGAVDVVTTDDTQFERCTADGLALNVEVEVEGRFDADGVLVASEVKCEIEANADITARVDAVDPDAGTITVLGLTVSVDEGTSYQDKSDASIREFGLGDIAVDDPVRIRAYLLPGSDDRIAKRIRRERGDRFDGPEVKGPVDVIGDEGLVVAGIDVAYADDITFELDDESVSEADFFAALNVGDRVKVSGTETEDGILLAREIEREEDDDDDSDDD